MRGAWEKERSRLCNWGQHDCPTIKFAHQYVQYGFSPKKRSESRSRTANGEILLAEVQGQTSASTKIVASLTRDFRAHRTNSVNITWPVAIKRKRCNITVNVVYQTHLVRLDTSNGSSAVTTNADERHVCSNVIFKAGKNADAGHSENELSCDPRCAFKAPERIPGLGMIVHCQQK